MHLDPKIYYSFPNLQPDIIPGVSGWTLCHFPMKDSGRAVSNGQTSTTCVNVDSVATRVAPVDCANPPPWSTPSVFQKSHNWNTKNLPARIVVDVASAACAAVLVAPVITTIDKYDRRCNCNVVRED
jgi:hypothetical protein